MNGEQDLAEREAARAAAQHQEIPGPQEEGEGEPAGGTNREDPQPQDPASPPAEYAAIREQAEKAYADKSYADARDLYQRAAGLALPKADKRWVDFRLADTSWRAQAGSNTADSTVFQIWQAFATPEQTAYMREQYAAGIGWGQAKKELFGLIDAEIAPARARYNELMNDVGHIEIVLKQGAEKARAEAQALLSKVRRAVGIAPLI